MFNWFGHQALRGDDVYVCVCMWFSYFVLADKRLSNSKNTSTSDIYRSTREEIERILASMRFQTYDFTIDEQTQKHTRN